MFLKASYQITICVHMVDNWSLQQTANYPGSGELAIKFFSSLFILFISFNFKHFFVQLLVLISFFFTYESVGYKMYQKQKYKWALLPN